MYDYIIFTHIPVFYKINLYNKLSELLKIHVVFIAKDTDEKRSSDFINTKSIKFSYDILSEDNFQNRNKFRNIRKINYILSGKEFKRIIVSGWDLLEFWYLIYIVPKRKNHLALESTILESGLNGIKGRLKKLFLSRVTCVFASGALHKKLLEALNYKGDVKITKGVGIINKPHFDKIIREYKKKYLYIGRLSEEKNLTFLIRMFNEFPDCQLTIIGTGPLEEKLKQIAKINIVFFGQVHNERLKQFYLDNDFLVLPSLSEPWGLVVDEALYFGMPVIISNRCGVNEIVIHGENGFVFSLDEQLKNIIQEVDGNIYSQLINNINKKLINSKDAKQVNTYVD